MADAKVSRAEEARKAAAQVGKGRPGVAARHWLWQLSLACALLFCVDAYYVLNGFYTIVDRGIELFVQGFPWGPMVYVFDATNAVAGLWQLLAGVAVAAVMAVWDRRAGWLLLIGSGASVIDNLVKVLVARHRPASDLVHVLNPATGYSFPSGHAVFYTWLAVMLASALAPRLKPALRPFLWLVASLLILVACLGRVYEGVHWPTDVIGGFLLGLSWSAFVLWLPERYLPTPTRTWFRRPRAGRRAAT
jgi:membrane-associated phospholipid phosphatase